MAKRRDPGALAEREPASLSSQQRSTMLRSAALRPINVMILMIGVVMTVITTTWWLLPLTLATYAALIFLAARDPIFQRKVLGGNRGATLPPATTQSSEISPERRARWLPRGETRQKVEATLEVYRKVVAAIEASDDVTRTVLDDAVPRLDAAAARHPAVKRRLTAAWPACPRHRPPAGGVGPWPPADLPRGAQSARPV